MNKSEQRILQLAYEKNGIIRTQDVTDAGLRRDYLATLVKMGHLLKIRHGLYQLYDTIVDDQVELQKRYPNTVFSYGNALYFHNLSDRVPHHMTITVLQGANVSQLKKDYVDLEVHYVKNKEILDLGKTTGENVFGQPIILYDKERCICDLVKDRKHLEKQLFTDALKGYFKSDSVDYIKLIRYAKKLGVEDKVRLYMEVL